MLHLHLHPCPSPGIAEKQGKTQGGGKRLTSYYALFLHGEETALKNKASDSFPRVNLTQLCLEQLRFLATDFAEQSCLNCFEDHGAPSKCHPR
jgi:hypothetical protein